MPSILERWKAFFRPNVYYFSLGNDAPTQVLNFTAKQLYQTQENLRAVVDYLSNSIAQLPLYVYTRKDENDRAIDRISPAARTLWRPNGDQTEYEFIRALAIEYFVFGAVYVWVAPDADSESGYQLRIIPSEWVISTENSTAYAPETIRVCTKNGGMAVDIPRSEFVQFRTYSAGNPGGYLSPISALRQTLEEQIQAGRFRKELWKSSGRLNAQIIRPKDVQPWDDETRKRFIESFRESWGSGGSKAGAIPLMEDGMEIKPFQTSFKEQQWMESVTLSREAVAAAYGVNPSLIWHTGTQTYASAKDNARALYADCLGPILQMLQQRINSFLLPMIGGTPDTYVEFDLTEKLKGSFEERASILQASVGGPWLTRNEARADNNLPPVDGGDDLIVPMNVVAGGQASPQDTHMDGGYPAPVGRPSESGAEPETKDEKPSELRIKARSTKEEDERMADVMKKFFERQKKSVLPKMGAKTAKWWDKKRWDKELADDIEPVLDDVSDSHGEQTSEQLGYSYDAGRTRNYLRTMAVARAGIINDSTYKKLLKADKDHTPEDVFDKRAGVDAAVIGGALALAAAGWATEESCRQAQDEGDTRQVYKEWVTGPNPRGSHAMMDGEQVPMGEPFSNGAMWPGDDNLDADESCNCNCHVDIVII